MLLTIVFVWLFGLGTHRSLFENSIISTWILTTALYAFLFVGLYKGFKLKDNLGKVTRTFTYDKITASADNVVGGGDSYLEAVITLILMSGTLLVLLANILLALWTGILVFAAILYWYITAPSALPSNGRRYARAILERASYMDLCLLCSTAFGFTGSLSERITFVPKA